MGLALIQAPAEEPVSLAEAKAHCRVDADLTDDDGLIGALISAARRQAEHITGRALVTQSWRLTQVAFPRGSLTLPRPPLQSVTNITYQDTAGSVQTYAPTGYQVITDEILGRIVPAYDTSWPCARSAEAAVVVDFVAGYGAAADVPQDIKRWILLAVGTLYAQREAIVTGTIVAELPRALWDALLDPYRIWSV